MMEKLVIAEKPSVARDLARVLGANQARMGYFRGNGITVTWAIGHLVTLPEPHEISPGWKVWRKADLPLLPSVWPLKIIESTRGQYRVVKDLLQQCDEVICATDAGREGELIFRYLYEAARCRKKVKRLWISSLTPDAIRAGMSSLKDGSAYDSLADAARARSRADWLVGMNLSRAYALTYGDRFFVGRVQTPTLALVVQRDREIADFRSEDYLELEASFGAKGDRYRGLYLGESKALSAGVWSRTRPLRLPPDGKRGEEILARVQRGHAEVRQIEPKTNRLPPPLLYDLTELQRHANRLFGFSASRTLQLAQALYERHKVLSYPRTDSRHLTRTVAETLPRIVAIISEPYRGQLRPGTGKEPLSFRYVDDKQVTDHHAIIPTHLRAAQLGPDERKIYDLVCRRLLSLWQGDYVTAVTNVLTGVGEGENIELFRSQGTLVLETGWKVLEVTGGKAEGESNGTLLPRGLAPGLGVAVEEAKLMKRTTRPPPPLNDASLLAGMETAGRAIEDRELQRAIRESGLGTPATRAGIIETLLTRGYLERQGKALRATSLGARLIATVHSSVKSPELTARWEQELAQIQARKRSLSDFMVALEKEIKERVADVLTVRPPPNPGGPQARAAKPSAGAASSSPPKASQSSRPTRASVGFHR